MIDKPIRSEFKFGERLRAPTDLQKRHHHDAHARAVLAWHRRGLVRRFLDRLAGTAAPVFKPLDAPHEPE